MASPGGQKQPGQSSHDVQDEPRKLQKGMVLLKEFLSQADQSHLAEEVRRLGQEVRGGFYDCHNEKTKKMRMMNLGRRTDGGRHPQEVPPWMLQLAVRTCQEARAADPSIPLLRPDMCVVNHYGESSCLGWHQDLVSRRDRGLPVVSLSLGHCALFEYKSSWRRAAVVKHVRLDSGDALVFGGRSRGIIHSVRKVSPLGEPLPWPMPEGGRYNLNFREL